MPICNMNVLAYAQHAGNALRFQFARNLPDTNAPSTKHQALSAKTYPQNQTNIHVCCYWMKIAREKQSPKFVKRKSIY